jgi:hypothetical protein
MRLAMLRFLDLLADLNGPWTHLGLDQHLQKKFKHIAKIYINYLVGDTSSLSPYHHHGDKPGQFGLSF